MKILAVISLSVAIHMLILLLPFPDKQMKKQEIIPITVVDITKEEVQKKEKPAPKKRPKKVEPVKKQEVVKKETVKDNSESVSKNNQVEQIDNKVNKTDMQNKQHAENQESKQVEKPFKPKGADDPLVLPDINVPLTENIETPEIKIPDIPKPEIKNEMVENKKSIDIAKELSALKSASNQNSAGGMKSSEQELSKAVQTEAEVQKKEMKTNLYNFDIAPTGNRKVLYVPADPVFALTNDTSVTIKFNIDKAGNTYNITFVSRTSTDIEKLAYDYISKMKFDAVIEDREDFAQITMFFKVQK